MKPESTSELSGLRDQIKDIDEQMIKLIAKRVELAREVGKVKLSRQLPIKDFKVEKDIIDKARSRARDLGVYEDLIEDILKLQIRYSVMTQEEFHTRARKLSGDGKRIAIVGGLGKMGLWLAHFFDSFGHQVSLVDPQGNKAANKAGYQTNDDLGAICKESDFIVLATPMSRTAEVIRAITATKTKAIVFDICSLKSPIHADLLKAKAAGIKVGSVHPMFGPSADMLAGKNIVLCTVGDDATHKSIRALFEGTTANLVDMPVEEHDNLMSIVLGLSHLLNLSFARTICSSNAQAKQLEQVASSTFRAQMDVTRPVVNENQDLYYEIQKANAHTPDIVKALIRSIEAYLKTIEADDREGFKALMAESKNYLLI